MPNPIRQQWIPNPIRNSPSVDSTIVSKMNYIYDIIIESSHLIGQFSQTLQGFARVMKSQAVKIISFLIGF